MSEQGKDATSQMVAAVLKEGHAKNHHYFSETKAGIEADYSKQVQELDETLLERYKKINQTITHTYGQKAHREELLTNQALVQEKQRYLTQLFQEVMSQMENWTAAEFFERTGTILKENELKGKVAITVGAYSASYMTTEKLAELAEAHGDIEYVLNETVVPNDGGFILSQDGIEYNYLFSSVLEQVREDFEFKMVALLFSDRSD